MDKDDIIEGARRVRWHPDHFFIRLKNWTESMDWDWCISRQRVFATPSPIWYCKKCGKVIIAEEDELPVDPLVDKPKIVKEGYRCECGSSEIEGERDVLDTWMDSSITPLWIYPFDKDFETVDLRPQGHDIIRTWAFYTILRSLALTGKIPWKEILINGMVLGEDGYKMSKSRDNIISPEEVIRDYGADAFRQWAAIGGATGSDIQFRWADIISARRFLQKLWSILRFSMIHLEGQEIREKSREELRVVDRWLISKLRKLVRSVTESMENYEFDNAMKSIKSFCWGTLADRYIELVKSRLYGSSEEGRESARYTLYVAMKTISRLIAPFFPFLSEEMYSCVVRDGLKSVHLEKWPSEEELFHDTDAERRGDLINDIASAIRRYKSDRGIALNKPMKKIEIYGVELSDEELEDIRNASATPIELRKGDPEIEIHPTRVIPDMKVLGPLYRDKAKDIAVSIENADAKRIKEEIEEKGSFEIELEDETVEIGKECVTIENEMTSRGRVVDVLEVDDVLMLIQR